MSPQSGRLETKQDFASAALFDGSRYQRRVFGDLLPELHRLASSLMGAADAAIADPTLAKFLPLKKVAHKLLDCSRTPYLTFDPTSVRFHLHEYRCKSRLCPRCSVQRSQILRANLTPYAKELNSPRFLTVGLKGSDEPLKDQLSRLTKSFTKLRNTKLWKKNQAGGFYTIEVTFNEKTQRWNPHLHAIIDGNFMPQKAVSDAWLKATGDSPVVDIRACRDRQQALHYITKYVSKTNDVARYPTHKLAEWALAMKGQRFVSTFGHLRGKKILDEEIEIEKEYTHVGHIAPLGRAANCGDERAKELWESAIGEAQKGGLPDDARSKEKAIEMRLDLYRQLTLWIGHWQETGEFLGDPDPEPPPLPDPAYDYCEALFDISPAVGDQ